MGGGDLNLKKSWHPQTLHNIEKVWKAEQKAEAEAKKIEQLQRELNEEREREEMQRYAVDQGITKKKSDRLEWMYSAPGHSGVNREEYLLGKSIDKAVDPLAVNEQQSADAPGASFIEDAPNAGTDLATKIRDDPLFMIKKKETEKKKELLKNPVRMKQLQDMLKADLGHKSRKKSKKEKKKRKKEKRKKYSSDENTGLRNGNASYNGRASNSESSDDVERPSHYKTSGRYFDNRASEKHRDKLSSKTVEDAEERRERRKRGSSVSPRREEPKRKYRLQDSQNYSSTKRSSRSPRREERPNRDSSRERNFSSKSYHGNSRSYNSRSPSPVTRKSGEDKKDRFTENRRNGEKSRRKQMRSSSRSESSSSDRGQNDTRQHTTKNVSQRSSPERRRYNHDESRSLRKRSPQHTAARKPPGRVKMTEEERERKLAEMMDNAKWRDEQRGKNVKKYREEEENEEKEMAKNKEKGASFVRPMKVDTYTSSTASVENRIKRNIHSLQRTPAALENFLKK